MEKYKKGAKMKEKFNQENFRKLLRKGIGERTQKEFAKQTHVALITINHMLNKPQIPHPKQKTLKAFAENMENVSLEELMVACGYAELSIEDMVRNLEASINDFFLKQNRMFFENEEEIRNQLSTYLTKANYNVSVLFRDFTDSDRENGWIPFFPKHAERAKAVEITWEYQDYDCRTEFFIYYVKTEKGQVVFLESDVEESCHATAANRKYIGSTLIVPKAPVPTLNATPDADVKRPKTMMTSFSGYGFYIQELPPGASDFLKKHNKSDSFSTDSTDEKAICMEIARIMKEETGLLFEYYPKDYDVPKSKRTACIMVKGATYSQENALNKEFFQYMYACAKELGIASFGTVYYMTCVDFAEDQIYIK